MTSAFALLGHPVSHSLSPRMFNALFARRGIDAHYRTIDVPPCEGEHLVRIFHEHALQGANLTVPHKTAILPLLSGLSTDAQRAGAVNVIVREGEGLVGHNTDVQGFADSLLQPPGDTAVVLGAGGAARAIWCALMAAGVSRIYVLNRSSARARSTALALAQLSTKVRVSAHELSLDSFNALAPSATTVVNCTTAGAKACVDTFRPSLLPHNSQWIDINYWDDSPPAQKACADCDIPFQTGHSMLAHQGARAFELFTDQAVTGAELLSILGSTP